MRAHDIIESLLIILQQIREDQDPNDSSASTKVRTLYPICNKLCTDLEYLRQQPALKLDSTVRYIFKYSAELIQYVEGTKAAMAGDDKKKAAEAAVESSQSILISAYVSRVYDIWDKVVESISIASDIGNSIKPLQSSDLGSVTFKQIQGLDNVVQKLIEGFVNPFVFPLLFPKKATGVLFYGLPGTGKTLLAKAAVHELEHKALFFAPPVNVFKGQFEGQTETKIATLFENISTYLDRSASDIDPSRPRKELAILFIDEADSLLGTGREQGDASKQRTVNSFLQYMDGIKSDPRITVFLSTNFPYLIDTAILRRLSLRVHVPLPSERAIEQLVKLELIRHFTVGHIAISKDVDNQMDNLYYLFEKYGTPKLHFKPADLKTVAHGLYTGQISPFPTNSDDDNKNNNQDQEKRLGFAPSDIIKGLQLAFNIAARRAVAKAPPARFLEPLLYGSKPGLNEYDVVDLTKKLHPIIDIDRDLPYIYNTKPQGGYTIQTDVTTENAPYIPPDLAVSYDFRLSDIQHAFNPRQFQNSSKLVDLRRILRWEQGHQIINPVTGREEIDDSDLQLEGTEQQQQQVKEESKTKK